LSKKLNTYLKGDVLEEKSFELFSQMLSDDRFYVPGKSSKIFRKRKYYSKDREADIIFDMAIETTFQGAETYSLLTLFECKNYDNSVQVGDVESFSDRVKQVGGHKAIMVTTSPFEKSALKIAQTRKIGIVRITSNNEIEWINHRQDAKDYAGKSEYQEELICGKKPIQTPVLITLEGTAFTSIQDLFMFLGVIDQYFPPLKDLKIEYKSDAEIEERIAELNFNHCYDHYKLNIEKLCGRISEMYDADIRFDEAGVFQGAVIGKIEYDPLAIYINPNLVKDSPRWRFTLAHEIGHLVLHGSVLKKYLAVSSDNDELEIMSPGISADVLKRMEIQANKFASLLLMPSLYFEKAVNNYFKRNSITKGFIYWDHQIQNAKLALTLLAELETIFGVSKEAAKVNLKQRGFLKGGSDGSVADHLRNFSFRNEKQSPF